MEYIITGLIIILCLYAVGFVVKKKYYKEVDRLEEWKIAIMNRPVLEELSKVKQLNMNGETEKLFENWRNDWDDIVATQLPDVEEYLFDAEECIDKYRFRKAKEIMAVIREHLDETEEKIKALVDEINDLVGSEEKNRIEIEELKDKYRECRKTLLAHSHNYGKAEEQLQKILDEVNRDFQQFDEQTNHGDYFKAREVVLLIKSMMEDVIHKMEVIPNLLVECRSRIPSQLDELKMGYREMLKQGYVLDHIQLEKEIFKIQKEIETYLLYIENLEIEEVEKGLEDIRENMDLLYDLFEKEVKAKQFIFENEEKTRETLDSVCKTNEQLKEQIENVRQSYHLPENSLQEAEQLEKRIADLVKNFELLEHKIKKDETAFSLLEEELSKINKQLQETQDELTTFLEQLEALRKDEIEAREKVQELSKKVAESIKIVSKSNIPGLPDDYKILLGEAKESINNVKIKLEEQPLNIPNVKDYLEIAVMTVEKMVNTTQDLVETVMLAEKVIQYGNRFRSRYPSVEKGLREAESSFRGFDYQTALEQAATAIEEIEPGALKKIEAWINEEVTEY